MMRWLQDERHSVAHTDGEREGVQLHLARVKIAAGYFDEAQAHIDAVTNAIYGDLKRRLQRSLKDHKFPATNSVPEISQDLPPAMGHPPVSDIPAAPVTSPVDLTPTLQAEPPAPHLKPQP